MTTRSTPNHPSIFAKLFGGQMANGNAARVVITGSETSLDEQQQKIRIALGDGYVVDYNALNASGRQAALILSEFGEAKIALRDGRPTVVKRAPNRVMQFLTAGIRS